MSVHRDRRTELSDSHHGPNTGGHGKLVTNYVGEKCGQAYRAELSEVVEGLNTILDRICAQRFHQVRELCLLRHRVRPDNVQAFSCRRQREPAGRPTATDCNAELDDAIAPT